MDKPVRQKLVRVTIDVLVTVYDREISAESLENDAVRCGGQLSHAILRHNAFEAARAAREVLSDPECAPILVRSRALNFISDDELVGDAQLDVAAENQLLDPFRDKYPDIDVWEALQHVFTERIVSVTSETFPAPGDEIETGTCVFCKRLRQGADLVPSPENADALQCGIAEDCERGQLLLEL